MEYLQNRGQYSLSIACFPDFILGLGGGTVDPRFEPVIWPEDKPPQEADSYRQCEICTQKSRVVWGEGNPNASILIVLDNPGAREDKDGNAYVCPTRRTLQTALHHAGVKAMISIGLFAEMQTFASTVKKGPGLSASRFDPAINGIHPNFMVCLGDVATQAMFDNKDASVKNLREHGIRSWRFLVWYPTIRWR